MDKQSKTIFDFIPIQAHSIVAKYIKKYPARFIISKKRFSKHGDYRFYFNGFEQISINSNLSPHRFLITLIHEVSHLVAFKVYGKNIRPHGVEWKKIYRDLMTPLINSYVFPEIIIPVLKKHFINPKASSDSDTKLVIALDSLENNDKIYVFNIPEGKYFQIYNGRIFKKGRRLRKRFECQEKSSNRKYLFSPIAEVECVLN